MNKWKHKGLYHKLSCSSEVDANKSNGVTTLTYKIIIKKKYKIKYIRIVILIQTTIYTYNNILCRKYEKDLALSVVCGCSVIYDSSSGGKRKLNWDITIFFIKKKNEK